MGVQNGGAFTVCELIESPCAAAVDTWLAMQMFNSESVGTKLFSDRSDLIQHRNDAPVVVGHFTHHDINQNLRTADPKRVNDMTHGRSNS